MSDPRRRFWRPLLASTALLLSCPPIVAAEAEAEDEEPRVDQAAISAIKFRSIGPALMSGRIGDFAVNPHNPSEYYVAACSGGVWKTTNSGTTYTPIFDGEGSFSIGCLALDPNNTNVIWVGTGENNSQRSVGFGDGVYKSVDGGKSWTHMGLDESEHIGMIAIDPRDSDTVYVAAQGPLWRTGGDRGLYKTTDGGASWERILHISDDTGANEVHMDPRDPGTLYVSAYQRRRHVWTLINGGPESGVHKSTDGGATWTELTSGLPTVDMGRIGLDISPANPDYIYAVVEAADGKSGFFRSTDRGESWEKRSDYSTSSPQYYNEIYCDPLDTERVYTADTYMHVTTDGGATFTRNPLPDTHVDAHAIWIDPDDTRHFLLGVDGGVYETWDQGATFQYKTNLPLTQFYKLAIDYDEPFYNVYGGTQDNNTQGGPSRTTNPAGITNDDWFITVGGDGFEPAVDPVDPNIVYSQWQHGGLIRYDKRSGEIVDVKPRERPGDKPYVWNWNAPLLISPHDHQRLYFGANYLFRSEDRGDSWEMISGDLTRGIDRNQLEVMGRIQPPDAVSKHRSTSIYGNSVALTESPIKEGLLYVGTDDGLIHVTEDGGRSWRKMDEFPDVPEMTYVSFLAASQHDADVVFAAFENHKMGDFTPYLLRSDDRGRSWQSIAGDLPERGMVWTMQQDHVDPDLLFAGTEFGAFVTQDGGETWVKLSGIPTIAVMDLEIQRRESDVVVATFGRGFYVLDDYAPLRDVSLETLEEEAEVYPVRDAHMYIETSRLGMPSGRGFQGASYYAAPNPPYGAIITYSIGEKFETLKEKRHKAEEEDEWDYPTIEEFRAEDREPEPKVMLTIRDEDGEVVRRIAGSREAGLHRTAWDLRYPQFTPTSLTPVERSPWSPPDAGALVAPGRYTVEVSKVIDGVASPISDRQTFRVIPLNQGTFDADDREAVLAFQKKVSRLQRAVLGALRAAGEAEARLAHIEQAIKDTPTIDQAQLAQCRALQRRLDDILVSLRGDPTLGRRVVPSPPSIVGRLSNIVGNQWWTMTAPTQTEMDQYSYAADAFRDALDALRTLMEDDLTELEAELESAGAPWTPGRIPAWSEE